MTQETFIFGSAAEEPRQGTQASAILNTLKSGAEITALDALDKIGCFRLAARIKDLKQLGWEIESRPVKTSGGAVIAGYKLKR